MVTAVQCAPLIAPYPQGREFGPIPPKTLPPLTVAATLRL